MLALEQYRNRALNQLNTQFLKLTTTGFLIRSDPKLSALLAEVGPMTASINIAINEIHAADAEQFSGIVESSWIKVLDFLKRSVKAFDSK